MAAPGSQSVMGRSSSAGGAATHIRVQPRSRFRLAMIAFFYCAVYVALDWLSDVFAWSSLEFTLWNPQSALTLALVAAYGRSWAAFAFPATLLAEYASNGAGMLHGVGVPSALVLAAGYAALSAGLRPLLRIDQWQGDMRQLVTLLLFLAIGILGISAAVVGLYMVFGHVDAGALLPRVGELWVGDMTGVLALLPLLLLIGADPLRWRVEFRRSLPDIGIFVAGLSLSAVIVFADFTDELQFFYLLFVPIIWLAVRRGIFGATLAVFLSQLGIAGAVLMHGYQKEAFLSFQMLTLILSTTGLLLGSAVTARESARRELLRHQREMDAVTQVTAIGTMGSALAHEISQPLASIFTYARACQLLLDKGEAARDRLSETLTKIGTEAERAGQVLRNMRNMLAEGTAVHERLDLDAIVARAADIVQREPAAAAVNLVTDLHGVPRIAGDPRHIEQVIVNILRNAIEATAMANPGGEVRVSAVERGRHVEIAIDDQGGGIPAEIEPTLFDPFTSTKPLGMGLGLAISRKLVELCGGDISITARAGGSRFVIRLPAERA